MNKLEENKHIFKGIFYLADKKINEFMRMLDLSLDGKYFCSIGRIKFLTSSKITKKYIMKLINNSFEEASCLDYNIAAIYYKDEIYFHDSVKILSDGENFIRVGQIKNNII